MFQNKHLFIITLLALGLALLATACQGQGAEAAPINEVVFTARDFSFSGPEAIPAGWTQLRLENEGPDYHHMQLVKLADGKTLQDLTAAFEESPVLPEWAEEYGGPNPPEAGESSQATVYLQPGDYALICTVPDKQGTPHVMHGMVKNLTVTAAEGETAREPQADATLDMLDFTFELSQSLAAGQQTIRVNNKGQQPHEVFLARLEPGKTMDDFLISFTPDAPAEPVWRAAGGVSVIEPGAHGYFSVDLEPGQYVLACFAPDSESGMPHLMMGMVQEMTVE